MGKLFLTSLICMLLIGCKSSKLPTTKYSQFEFPLPKLNIVNNNLEIYLQNPVKCPLRVWIEAKDNKFQEIIDEINPIEIKNHSDTLIRVNNVPSIKNFSWKYRLGSVSKKIKKIKVELPFPKNKEYRIIQGNNDTPTHNKDWSRYAIDFSLKINDTICAATSGYVVGVVDKYKYGGEGDKWKPFGNFITIYEPDSGIFTQYAHLVENGSFVSVGDHIENGQPIALSGKTGQTNIEHLHFNCLIPVSNNEGLKSIPITFKEGYQSIELIENDLVKK